MTTISFARHQFLPAVIRYAVWLYIRFILSFRDVAGAIIAGTASDFKGQKIYEILCYSFFVFTCFRFEISKFYLKPRVYLRSVDV